MAIDFKIIELWFSLEIAFELAASSSFSFSRSFLIAASRPVVMCSDPDLTLIIVLSFNYHA